MAEVVLDGVRREYDDTTALDGVDLAIEDGEFFTLVGPSGCGKTTTLRTVAGLEEPTAGSVAIGGETMAGVPPEERDVGIVFQSYALFPHMSVGENVAYGLRFRDPPAGQSDDERVSELLELVDLAGFEERSPEELSGGQRQRVALARALAPGPELLLLDEPMSALDARLRERLRRQVRSIQSELGVTTVYVTHDQEEALAVSDRVAVMNDGAVEQVGTPQEVYRSPETPFVATFLGENNRFEGVPTGRDDGALRVDVSGTTFQVADGEARDGDGTANGVRDGSVDASESLAFYVRPEALAPDCPTNRFTLTVETSEFLGEDARTYGRWNGEEVVVRTETVPDGEELTVGFDPSNARTIR